MATQPVAPRLDWQTIDTYKTPMDIAWQFDYEIGIEKLRNLYSKAKQNQWDGEVQLHWSARGSVQADHRRGPLHVPAACRSCSACRRHSARCSRRTPPLSSCRSSCTASRAR